MNLTEAKLKEMILEMMDDELDDFDPVEKIAAGMKPDLEHIDNMLFMADSMGLSLGDLGQHLDRETSFYMGTLVANETKPEWAPMLVTSNDPNTLDMLISAWRRDNNILSDEELATLAGTRIRSIQNRLAGWKVLPEPVLLVLANSKYTEVVRKIAKKKALPDSVKQALEAQKQKQAKRSSLLRRKK